MYRITLTLLCSSSVGMQVVATSPASPTQREIEMQTIGIDLPLSPGATDLQLTVAKEVASIREQGAKVYRTYVTDGGHSYTLVTTSKDIHLAIGLFSVAGQRSFCELLDVAFVEKRNHELLLTYGHQKKAIHVTRSMHSDSFTVYQLSPAH
jgi:hypothetical protein